MTHRLPSLTAIGLWCGFALVLFASSSSAQQPTAPLSTLHSPLSTSPGGQELIERAARELDEAKSLECRLRQRIEAFDQELVGAGTYLQFGVGEERRLRMEIKLQVGNRVSSIQQICDGRRLWIRRDFPDGQNLTRIDLRRVREAAAERSSARPPQGAWLEGGGLPNLVDSLAKNFDFEVQSESDPAGEGELATVVLEGRWKKDRLEALLAASKSRRKKGGATIHPAPTPDRVDVTLGSDKQFTLFPYRIEYYGQPESAEQGRGGERKLLCGLEFYDLRRVTHVDPRQFEYLPGDQEVIDGAETYFARWFGAGELASGD